MKAVMYHYVRPAALCWPRYGCLDSGDFSRQLDSLLQSMRVPSLEEFSDALARGVPIEDGLILTFDDGLKDHYRFVMPELQRRGLWGIFYVTSGVYEKATLLDVHRIHVLLGTLGASECLDRAWNLVSRNDVRCDREALLADVTYPTQAETDAVVLKRLLNFYLSPELRSAVLERLVGTVLEGEASVAESYYLNRSELVEMHEAGMVIGNHTRSHPMMSDLGPKEQRDEIAHGFEFVDAILGAPRLRTFCYPYGGEGSFTLETETILSELDCKFSFSVEPRAIEAGDLGKRPQALPRFDCCLFPHGHFHQPKPMLEETVSAG